MQNTEYQVSMDCPDQSLKSCPNGPIMKKQFTKKGNIEGCALCCAICTEKGACKFTCDAVRATLTPAAPVRTIGQIEADIAAQLEMGAQLREMYLQAFAKASTPILIRIGECLKEEKEACKAAKISFADRIRERFGFSQRTAENYMTLAAEISPDSPIAQLPYTKALALTALPSGEREAFAAEIGADSLSKKQLQDAIKEKQEAERRERQFAESARIEAEKRRKAEQKLEQARDELSTAQRGQDALKEQLESEGIHFSSQTDTEVISQLLEKNYDGSFLSSEVGMLPDGRRRAILTFPNKDRIVLAEGDEVELCYDEFFESMGGNNHNVYEGTVALELE